MAEIHVLAAALVDERGRVLLARRPDGSHQGGLWEFPGGKREAGEGRLDALGRELAEELGVVPERCRPLIEVRHAYADRRVRLDVWRVERWRGEPRGREGQPLIWAEPARLRDFPMPAADAPVCTALELPETCLVTPEPEAPEPFLAALETALARGARLVQFRAPGLDPAAYHALAMRVIALCRDAGARVLLNADPARARELGADGAHLNGRRLRAAKTRPLPAGMLLSAACHDAAELQRAHALDVDFVLCSPVAPTASHPGARPLGWDGLESLCRRARVPVYALGGLGPEDLSRAWQRGAQGIAAIRALWPARGG